MSRAGFFVKTFSGGACLFFVLNLSTTRIGAIATVVFAIRFVAKTPLSYSAFILYKEIIRIIVPVEL